MPTPLIATEVRRARQGAGGPLPQRPLLRDLVRPRPVGGNPEQAQARSRRLLRYPGSGIPAAIFAEQEDASDGAGLTEPLGGISARCSVSANYPAKAGQANRRAMPVRPARLQPASPVSPLPAGR